MSRIGKAPVVIPFGVTITISAQNLVTVKGPKGELNQEVDKDIFYSPFLYRKFFIAERKTRNE